MWSKECFRTLMIEEIVQKRCTKSARRLHKVCKASAQSVQRTSTNYATARKVHDIRTDRTLSRS